MDELVLSLRIWMHSSSPALAADLSNAADTIDALRAEVAALRALLWEARRLCVDHWDDALGRHEWEARRLCVDHWDDALGRHESSPLAQRIDAELAAQKG